jgi:hypothetical protein
LLIPELLDFGYSLNSRAAVGLHFVPVDGDFYNLGRPSKVAWMGPGGRKQRDHLRDRLADLAIGLYRGEPLLPRDLRLQPHPVESPGTRYAFFATRYF